MEIYALIHNVRHRFPPLMIIQSPDQIFDPSPGMTHNILSSAMALCPGRSGAAIVVARPGPEISFRCR